MVINMKMTQEMNEMLDVIKKHDIKFRNNNSSYARYFTPDIPDKIMIVLHMWFLSRRLRITIKDIGSGLTGQRIVFKESNLFKLRASVCEDEGKEFEEIISEDILK